MHLLRHKFILPLIIIFLNLSITCFEQKINKYGIRISDSSGKIIYPFTQQEIQSYNQCGLSPTIRFEDDQVLYIQMNIPFIASLSTQQTNLKISGYVESIEQGVNKHIGILLASKSCRIPQSTFKFKTLVTFNRFEQKEGLYYNNWQSIEIPSFTFCYSQNQLQSLQAIINISYVVIVVIILTMVPSFPIKGVLTTILLLGLTFISQIIKPRFRILIFVLISFIVMKKNKSVIQRNLEVNTQRSLLLFKRSFTTLLLSYATADIFLRFQQTDSDEYKDKKILYVIGLYLENFCQLLILTQVLSSICWINRLRSYFWWILVMLGSYSLFPNIFNLKIFSSLSNEINSSFSLLLPSIFSQFCRYRTMSIIIILSPACQFMDRFNTVKFGGLIILVGNVMFASYSEKIGLLATLVMIILWLISLFYHQGYQEVVSRRWISRADFQELSK